MKSIFDFHRFLDTRSNLWFDFALELDSFLRGASLSKNSSNMSKRIINDALVSLLSISRVFCQIIFQRSLINRPVLNFL